MECYSAIIRNEVLIDATIGKALKTLQCMKEASHKRPFIVRFILFEISRTGKSMETESRLVAA